LAIGLFSYDSPSFKEDANHIISFNKIDENWNFYNAKILPDDLNDYLSRIIINDSPMGKKQNFNRDIYLNQIKKVFSNLNKYEKLLNACKWYYEGRVGDDQLLSFIQNTVVLEILLGEKLISDKIGIGELLRNRCAYFISNSDKERETILNEFKKIYAIRSKIVHSGKSKLNSKEIVLLKMLRFLCSRVIQKELSLTN